LHQVISNIIIIIIVSIYHVKICRCRWPVVNGSYAHSVRNEAMFTARFFVVGVRESDVVIWPWA
jgi:hypothetical protein